MPISCASIAEQHKTFSDRGVVPRTGSTWSCANCRKDVSHSHGMASRQKAVLWHITDLNYFKEKR